MAGLAKAIAGFNNGAGGLSRLTFKARVTEGEAETAARAKALGLHPDTAPMHLDDTLGQSQSNPGAVIAGIETLEKTEDTLMMTLVDTDTIVADEKDARGRAALLVRPIPTHSELYPWRVLLAHILDRVDEQIL